MSNGRVVSTFIIVPGREHVSCPEGVLPRAIAVMQSRQGTSKQSAGKLAVLAPREDQPNSSTDTNPSTPLTDLPRTRLPPRSRSGCWTCRTRKVKCDENRPRCNQCSRLGHRCDYSPKLAFKDETPKIVEKYLGPGGNPEWSPATPTSGEPSTTETDQLPPFTSLHNEEEWQRKASSCSPGTYFVVTNASSFESTDGEDASSSPETRVSSQQNENEQRHANVVVDSNTIILGSFEEMYQQINSLQLTSSNIQTSEPAAQTAGTPALGPPGHTLASNASAEQLDIVHRTSSLTEPAHQTDPWFHYRSTVRRYLLPIPGINLSATMRLEDAFQQEAKRFAPLENALMALTALSLCQTDGSQGVNALQHYDRAIGPLRHEHDPASDGAFLTHFVLLLYEIAGNESFWAYHMSSLKSIILTRRQSRISEPYPYVIWCACLIDINALLSGTGKGDFITAMRQGRLIPSAQEMLQSPPFLEHQPLLADNSGLSEAAWELQCNLCIVATEIAIYRHRLRTENVHPGSPFQQTESIQSQLAKLRDMLDETWNRSMSPSLLRAIDEQKLSECTTAILNAARVMYYSCIIYLNSHMLPAPPYHIQAADHDLVRDAARSILGIALELVQQDRFEQRYIVLPLLLAGTVLVGGEEYNHVQQLMQRLAAESLGSNTRASLRLLHAIFEQHQRSLHAGSPQAIHLFQMMENTGITVVHFGL